MNTAIVTLWSRGSYLRKVNMPALVGRSDICPKFEQVLQIKQDLIGLYTSICICIQTKLVSSAGVYKYI